MLAPLEDALALFASDAALRRRFARDRASVLDELRLEGRARTALESLSAEALERYAASLVAKRWSEVARVVPRTVRVAPSVERRYRTWLARAPAPFVATVLPPGCAEALRALPVLREELARAGEETIYAADLLAFEVLGACSRADGASRVMKSRFAIDRIAEDLARGTLPIDPDIERTELAFDGPRLRRRGW